MTKISVITICYNDREGLEKTLQSLFAQTSTDFEMVVIDGGSTDGSAELVKQYAGRFAFSVSEKDKGIYNAQNKGWQHAKGEYCLFLNSGDLLSDKETLERFAPALVTDIVYGDLLVDNGKDPLYRLGQPDPFTFEDFIYTTLFHPAAFIKRDLLEKRNGYDESFRIVADYDFFLEMVMVRKCSTLYVPGSIAIFNTAGIGSNPKNKKLHDDERRRSQLKYFPLEKILAAEKVVRKRKPRSLRLKESVSGIPLVRELTNFGLVMYNRIRKAGR